MKRELTFLTKLTAGGLVAVCLGIWMQWLSGDPSYTKFPPGPVLFIAAAAIVIWGRRWSWTPLVGALLALLTTMGWFVRLPQDMLRLRHPGAVGRFAPGIFTGTLLLIVALLVTDIAGIAATVQNFRRGVGRTADSAKMACRFFGAIFVLMGIAVMVSGVHVDKYHNLMHLTWGALAVGISFVGIKAAKNFCIASGAFYLVLAILGLLLGNPAANRAWHFGPMVLSTGDDIFHMTLGLIFLAIGLLSPAQLLDRPSEA